MQPSPEMDWHQGVGCSPGADPDTTEVVGPLPEPDLDGVEWGETGPYATLSLTAADWFKVRGHGWAAAVPGIPGFNPRGLAGQRVEIDGKTYVVRGVETFAVPDPFGHPFSLLVGER